jgi:hypothetical protein
MRTISSIAIATAAVMMGCATTTPATEWYYSSWIAKDGMPAEINFDQSRKACLAQGDITDPAAVAVGGDQERRFLECMDAAGWCTAAHGCD